MGFFPNFFKKKIIDVPGLGEADGPPLPEPEVVLSQAQMQALSNPEIRRAIRESAEVSLRGCNLSQREADFGRMAYSSGQEQGIGLLLTDNPEITQALRELYEASCGQEETKQDFEACFGLRPGGSLENAAFRLARMLEQFDRQIVPVVEYTDADSIRREVPGLLKQGFSAMALARSVQGPLRDQVNTLLSIESGREKTDIVEQWKRLEVLAGARGAAVDICSYFATEAFERGMLPQTGEEERQLKSCSCSLYYVNAPYYKAAAGKALESVTQGQAAYIRQGGDYRAFNQVKNEELADFLQGKVPGVRLSHRADYTAACRAAEEEQRAMSRTRITAEELRRQETGREDERRRGYGLDQKSRTLRSGSTGIDSHIGEHDRNGNKRRDRNAGRQWV